jgi:tetratricopeptide (TPR) repeat protein
MIKHGIAIIGVAILIFLSVASTASAPSASGTSALDRGAKHYENKEYDEAIADYTSAINSNPYSPYAYNGRGMAYEKKNNYYKAITDFTEAIRLDPNYVEAYFNRGMAYSKLEDYDKAIADYTEVIRLDPNYLGVYFNRGLAYSNLKDYNKAIADFTEVIRINPYNADAYNSRAWVYAYYLKRNFDLAISDANQALILKPNDANSLDTRGWAYLGNGDYEKATADFQMALKIKPGMQSSINGLAEAEELSYVQSDEDFIIKQNPDNTITITGYKGKAKNVVIPATLYGLKVTIIGSSAFRNKGLRSVVIPDTVITIEDGGAFDGGAFYSNRELTKVTLGNGLKTIGNHAFSSCYNLAEIIIPNSVTRIGDSAFSSAGRRDVGPGERTKEVFKVTFGTGLQTIGERAFSSSEIVELNLPSSIRAIGESAFAYNKIQKITFGSGLQTIEAGVFSNNQITELNLPSSLKTIRVGAFANNQIQSLNIPNGVTSISSYISISSDVGVFANNPLTTVIIPESLANGFSSNNFNKNTIIRITIPARMNESTLRDNFEEAFVNFWINQNRAGGTYVKRGPIWTKE